MSQSRLSARKRNHAAVTPCALSPSRASLSPALRKLVPKESGWDLFSPVKTSAQLQAEEVDAAPSPPTGPDRVILEVQPLQQLFLDSSVCRACHSSQELLFDTTMVSTAPTIK